MPRRRDPRRDVVRAREVRRVALTRRAEPAAAPSPVAPSADAYGPPRPEVLSRCVAVVPEAAGGTLSVQDRQAIAAALESARDARCPVLAVVLGPLPPRLDEYGIDAVTAIDGVRLSTPAARCAALDVVLAAHHAERVFFPDGPAFAGDLGRRLAVARGVRPTTGLVAFARGRALCAGAEPGVEYEDDLAPVVLVGARFPLPLDRGTRPTRHLAPVPLPAAEPEAVEDLGVVALDPHDLALSDAEFIVAGGAGVRDWGLFHELARALGATPAGSRVVVDAGLLPRDRQVGASGAIVSARCYLAFGISGAVQHLEGIGACGTVISVNVDDGCAMAKRADLSIVADAADVMRALLAKAREPA